MIITESGINDIMGRCLKPGNPHIYRTIASTLSLIFPWSAKIHLNKSLKEVDYEKTTNDASKN